jgi:hypothetical protein
MDVPLEFEAIRDFDEFVASAFDGRAPRYEELVEAYGMPQAVVRGYLELSRQEAEHEPPARPFHDAPGWKLTCTRCGRTRAADRVGPFFVRRGAVYWFSRWLLGWCRTCRRPTVVRLWRFGGTA